MIWFSDFFHVKKEREERNRKEFFARAVLDLPNQRRTFRQNAAVWKLVTVIFESMDGRLPDEEEKYGLYLDLLDVYADSLEGSKFIDGLLFHLATECGLSYETQTTVQEVLQEWEAWRGSLEKDPADYADAGQTEMLGEREWRARHVYSEASGHGGTIVRAHIVSRGSDAGDIEMAWNWVALLPEEHEEQHRTGWDRFLDIYPHLRGRVSRARNLAGKLELEFKAGRSAAECKAASLAEKAME
jgi:hypothetical protein